jgi:hypothetical protein
MYILWIIYFVGMIIVFAGLFENSKIFFFSGGVILLSATLVSLSIALKRYRNYSYKEEEKRFKMFLMMNRDKGLEDTKKGSRIPGAKGSSEKP